MGVDLGGAGSPDRLLDALREQREVVLGDRAALAGLPDADEHLGATEGLGGPAALDHHKGGVLGGGEPATALGTLPTAPDSGAVVGGSGVDHPGLGATAEGAVHDRRPPFR